MASEMVERVAAAIAEVADMDSPTLYTDMACAAIEALTVQDLLQELDRRFSSTFPEQNKS